MRADAGEGEEESHQRESAGAERGMQRREKDGEDKRCTGKERRKRVRSGTVRV